MTGRAGPLVLTVDELRALRRLADVRLPRFVTAADSGDVRVDAAALRGLAVRGLVELSAGAALDEPRVAAEVGRLLAPATPARVLAEVEAEDDGRITRYAVAAGPAAPVRVAGPPAAGPPGVPAAAESGGAGGADGGGTGTGGAETGPVVLLRELPAGMIAVELLDRDPAGVIEELCGLDEVTDPGTAEPAAERAAAGFTVDSRAQADADALAAAGDPAAARRVLTAAGVPERAARSWVAAVAGRRRAAVVSVARRLGRGTDGPYEAGELRLLVGGDGTAWRVRAAESETVAAAAAMDRRADGDGTDVDGDGTGGTGGPAGEPPPAAVVEPVGAAALRQEITTLLGYPALEGVAR